MILLTIIPGTTGWIEGWLNENYVADSIVPGWLMHAIMNISATLTRAF